MEVWREDTHNEPYAGHRELPCEVSVELGRDGETESDVMLRLRVDC